MLLLRTQINLQNYTHMKTNRIIGAITVGTLLLSGCISHENPIIKTAVIAVVVNEGNGNNKYGTVDYYYENNGTIDLNVLGTFAAASLQSVAITANGWLWVTANDPDKIEAFDAVTGRKMLDISNTHLSTPHQITAYENYLFVTNGGTPAGTPPTYPDSYVSVFSASNNFSHVRQLPCGADAEGLLCYKNRLFVATGAGVKVFDLSQASMPEDTTLASTIFTGSAKQLVVDASKKVWVSYTDGGLMGFDPETYHITGEYAVPVDAATGAIALTKDGAKIISYATVQSPLKATIYVTNLTSGSTTEWEAGACNVRSIGVSPFTGNIFTADTNYEAGSTLLIFNESGVKQGEQTTGVGAKGYVFFSIDYYE
jgi:hypothetical protein